MTYVVSRWGEPSQTFVRREAEALRARGTEVAAISLKPPAPCASDIPVTYLAPGAVALGVLRAVARDPMAVARVIATVVGRAAPRNLAPTLVAALVGVAWTGSRRLPAGHLHAHFGWVAATATWAAAAAGHRPSSVMLHAFEIHDERYCDRFTPVPLRAGAVFVESEKDQAIVRGRWGIEAGVVRLGVPGAWLDGTDAGPRQDDLVVVVGRLVEKKGHDVLIDAVARARSPWRVRIIGEGPLRPALEAQVARHGLAGRVVLAGMADEEEVRRWLWRAAVSALASVETATGDRDGTPTSLIEAMACGAAVVASDVGAIAELLADSGVVVPPGDPDALAEAFDGLADPTRRDALAAAARSRVQREWTSEASVSVLLDALALA